MNDNTLTKNGVVTITGKPNVGKSTLLNTLLKRKVAIATYKPQTTRNKILAKYKDSDGEIIFIDTPGFHQQKNKLDEFMNDEIKRSYKNSDIALILIDSTREINEEDINVFKLVNSFKFAQIIIAFTKCEKKNDEKINKLKKTINEYIIPTSFIEISSLNGRNIDKLIELIKEFLPNNAEPIEIEDNDDFTIAEIIREQIILNTKQEIPYSVGIIVNQKKYSQDKNVFDIQADIVVERENHKPIIIGQGGKMIKKIGSDARKELLEIFDCKIVLKLFVKVKKDWRENINYLKDLGYKNE